MAPFPRFGPFRHPSYNKRQLLRFLVPHVVRSQYRERLFQFHLNTLPRLKHKTQSSIYGYITSRRRRRADKPSVLRLDRRLTPHPAPAPRHGTRAHPPAHVGRTKMLPSTSAQGSQGEYGSDGAPGERGYRRKRLAAMAGSVYRAGASAVNEIRDSYAQTRTFDSPDDERPPIPVSFPNASIATTPDNREQMILFPTYAKRHVNREPRRRPRPPPEDIRGAYPDDEGWHPEFEEEYVPDAIVDVDVRGWIYAPLTGPLTRKNRIMMGLARQLSGIPKPEARPASNAGNDTTQFSSSNEDLGEQEKIAAEAARIEHQGQEERRAGSHGAYTENPGRSAAGTSTVASSVGRNDSRASLKPPSPPPPSEQGTGRTELTGTELAAANSNLLARLAPFLTTPFSQLPLTIFFYNESRSQSRTVVTNVAGHFNLRAALPFKPTHVRVLANESLSAVQEVKVTESAGVSLISDIDDTIKRSDISSGAREIFRNTFVRELSGLIVDGVKEWYSTMHSMGVGMHYCSNSPWQLYPLLTNFFKLSGLPPGSMHLKAYNGMLQGIFEPVAERKKPTLERILTDFPERKFILVGDSGEADLEVYTDLAVANPGRILAIFIRDVTTPEQLGFFDSSFEAPPPEAVNGQVSGTEKSTKGRETGDDPGSRPALPPRGAAASSKSDEVPTGNLIDLSDDSTTPPSGSQQPGSLSRPSSTKSAPTIRTPPPRPTKPASLKSNSVVGGGSPSPSGENRGSGITPPRQPPRPPPARKPVGVASQRPVPHPLSQTTNTSAPAGGGRGSPASTGTVPCSTNTPPKTNALLPPPPPPPRRNGNSTIPTNPRQSPQPSGRPAPSPRANTTFDFLPPSAVPPRITAPQRVNTVSSIGSQSSQDGGYASVNKKLELWRRRLERAQEVLEEQGVALYTWRRGQDVMREAVGIVRAELERKKR